MPAARLNRSQRAAVRTLSGPLLVLAGAGTGKTRVITYRIAELIKSGVPPSRILAVTFTNKAAREMKERAMALIKTRRKNQKAPEISTFHSLCVRILRRHVTLLGYPTQFSIYDRGDQESIARSVLREVRVGHEKLRPGDLLAIIGSWKSRSIRPGQAEAVAETDKELLAALAYPKYQAALKAAGAVDFDDLLLLTEQLFLEHPDARFAEASRFDHLLIDEYQDTNGLQYRIMHALAERHQNLCVVGDDDQSIYGWRGAEVTHILSFANDWPKAKVVRLEDNYRSREPILELANTLIAHNSTRHDKVLRAARQGGMPPRFVRFEDETQEAEGVVREIRQKIDPGNELRIPPSHIAILFRTNEQPRAFEMELRRHRVPYVLVGGMSFYDRKEVRDLMAYLRLVANPKDEVSLLRVINTPPRGIGQGTVQTLLEGAVQLGVPLWEVLPSALGDGRIAHAAGERIEAFRRLIIGVAAQLGSRPLVDVATDLFRVIDYRSELERLYKNPGDVESRLQSMEELVNSIGIYEQRAEHPSLIGFLEEAALAGRDDQLDDPKDKRPEHAVSLMTLHSAKGLEFPHVYMVGMEEGLLPHQRSVVEGGVEEERRLCYVGVTRAEDELTLSLCKSRMKWGKPRHSVPSRFLMEMRGETERAQRAAEASAAQMAEAIARAEEAQKKKQKKSVRKPRSAKQARRVARARDDVHR